MRVISVQQPWAQLVIDRRRHVILKDWKAEPGETFALHASHVRDATLAREFGYSEGETPTNAILGVIRVRKCMDRGLARPSKFDAPNSPVRREYAIAVSTVEKYRKPKAMKAPRPLSKTWECEL